LIDVTLRRVNPGVARRNAGTSVARADAIVGADARFVVAIRIELKCAEKVVEPADSVRAHPSGKSNEYARVGGTYFTNAWLSGMSPDGLTSAVLGVTLVGEVEVRA
jgi:hypothetical protein